MRTNVFLAVAAGVLAVPTFITYLADSNRVTSWVFEQRMFDGFNSQAVNLIRIRAPKPNQARLPGQVVEAEVQFDELAFRKLNDRWVLLGGELEGAPVKATLLEERLFRHIEEVRSEPEQVIFADADPDTLAESHLTPDTALIISCQQAGTAAGNQPPRILAEFLVGKNVSGSRFTQGSIPGFLVRRSDSNDVVLYEVPYWEKPMNPAVWVDKVVHNLNDGVVTRFSLKNSKSETPMVFERKPGSDGTWIAVEKPAGLGAIRQGEVSAMISRFKPGWWKPKASSRHRRPILPKRRLTLHEFGHWPKWTLSANRIWTARSHRRRPTGRRYVHPKPRWILLTLSSATPGCTHQSLALLVFQKPSPVNSSAAILTRSY